MNIMLQIIITRNTLYEYVVYYIHTRVEGIWCDNNLGRNKIYVHHKELQDSKDFVHRYI